MIMTEDEVRAKMYVFSCPECNEKILQENQIRCSNCKNLFDWEDEE